MATNTKTLLTVKIDKTLKERARKTAAEFGLPLGTMVNSLILNTVENRRLDLVLRPNARLLRSIAEAERDYKAGELKKFSSVEELSKDLRS